MGQTELDLACLAAQEGIRQLTVPVEDLGMARKLLLQLLSCTGLKRPPRAAGETIPGHAYGRLLEQRRQDQRRQSDRQEKHKQAVAYCHGS